MPRLDPTTAFLLLLVLAGVVLVLVGALELESSLARVGPLLAA